MKAVITESTHFNREVEVAPIAAQPGSYRLQFSSQLRSARIRTSGNATST